jgi:hypothetical protein
MICRMVFKLSLVIIGCAAFLSAQTYQGRILGTVTDATGAVVPAAQVSITNTATDITRTLVTNKDGAYIAPDLDPGTYSVTAEAPGFKKTESRSVILEVSRDVQVNLQLRPGAITEPST